MGAEAEEHRTLVGARTSGDVTPKGGGVTRGVTRGKARNDAMTRSDTISIEAISRARARARTRYQNCPCDTSPRVTTSPDHPPPDRHRRFRARRRAGIAVAQVEYGAAELDFLIKLKWLLETEVTDRDAVGRAIGAMLAASARR